LATLPGTPYNPGTMDLPEATLSQGLYPLAEAARLSRLDAGTARRWAAGGGFADRGERLHSPGVARLALRCRDAVADRSGSRSSPGRGRGRGAMAAVADWHGATARQVRDAVGFETAWPRRAA
jgi:hypothetical protein